MDLTEVTIGEWADYLDMQWDVGSGFLDTGRPDSDYDYSPDRKFRSLRIPKENGHGNNRTDGN